MTTASFETLAIENTRVEEDVASVERGILLQRGQTYAATVTIACSQGIVADLTHPSMGRYTMDAAHDDMHWRQFTDPRARFRVEIPAAWHVKQSEGTFTHTHQGHVWHGQRVWTTLRPAATDSDVIRMGLMSMTIRLEAFTEPPPPISWDSPEPSDLSYFRSYRITHDGDWLHCSVGHVRVHIQYEIHRVSRTYPPLGWEPPAPLSPDERQRRLALIQRIIGSFDLLAPSGE